mmetsp:Transcript_15212/g.29209  ORF Transcript_15212/g.29209 Transcript_15212/m.29209 type:complete len:106 (-) Transcript_15212:1668-1985(-)
MFMNKSAPAPRTPQKSASQGFVGDMDQHIDGMDLECRSNSIRQPRMAQIGFSVLSFENSLALLKQICAQDDTSRTLIGAPSSHIASDKICCPTEPTMHSQNKQRQ